MKKRMQILTAGLALSIFMAQPVYADILITPLDTKAVSQEKQAAQGVQAGTQTGQGTQGAEAGAQPGQETQGTGTSAFVYNTSAVEEPTVSAEAAILYDATHDQILFEKNADEKLYPASITKLMTALLVMEKASMTDTVTFSKTAVTNLESGAVTLGLVEGDKVSVKDCMYGLMLKSANEVANGLAEHVGGTIAGFADMMNQKAAELGCTNTHFVNPNGLNSSEHYTTARDMAKIAKAYFENETLCEISSTLSYVFPATTKASARTITPGHKMLYPSDSRYYEGIIGGKTGYTSLAGNTLVTCVEKDGVRMIAVILKASSTHYTDTKAMLDYGYELAAASARNQSAAGSGNAAAGTEVGPGMADAGGSQAASNQWVQAQDGSWSFQLSDGTRLTNSVAIIDGVGYGFDSEGTMVTGWKKYGEDWYCFSDNGAMVVNGWMQDGDKWFYLGSDGIMLRNALIDNTYYVGADGSWTQE